MRDYVLVENVNTARLMIQVIMTMRQRTTLALSAMVVVA